MNNKDPLVQLKTAKKVIEYHLRKQLNEIQGFKYVETLVVTSEKPSDSGDLVHKTGYFNCTPQTTISHNEIDKLLQLSKQMIINAIVHWTLEGSGWVISSVNSHYIKIVKYKPIIELYKTSTRTMKQD